MCGGGADDAVRGCSADDAEVVRRCAGAVRTTRCTRRLCGCSADDAEVVPPPESCRPPQAETTRLGDSVLLACA